MVIRKIQLKDAQAFLRMQMELDKETKFMLFEPGERSNDLTQIETLIQNILDHSGLLLVVEHHQEIIGYLMAQRRPYIRTRHRAYIVTGIRKIFQNQGIGKKLFEELDKWAAKQQLKRLELTVRTSNQAAKRLYEKFGYDIEGVKKASIYLDGEYLDEYYMAKILD